MCVITTCWFEWQHISSFSGSLFQIKYETDPSFSLTHRHRLQYISLDLLSANSYSGNETKNIKSKTCSFCELYRSSVTLFANGMF